MRVVRFGAGAPRLLAGASPLAVGGAQGFLHDPAHAQGVAQHAQAVADDVHLALGRVDPFHGEIVDAVAEALGEEEDFDVECEAVEGLAAEDLAAGAGTEGFEAALGVVDAGEGEALEDAVKDLAHALAQRGLAAADAAACMLAVADEDLRAGILLEMPEEVVDGCQRDAEVGIHVEDVLAPCAKHAGADGEAFAALDLVVDDLKIRLARGEAAGYVQRPIRAVLDDDQDLQRKCAAAREIREALERGGKAPGFIEGGENE